MQDGSPTCLRITIGLRSIALLTGVLCLRAFAAMMLAATSASASSAGGGADPDALQLPATWEGKLPAADGRVHWHLDLLPDQRYRLRRTHEDRTHEDEAAPSGFDEIGRWERGVDSRRLDLTMAGGKRVPLVIEADGSLRKPDTHGKPSAPGPPDRLERLPQARLIEPRLRTTGLFVYMADAAVITLCADGSRLPVAMEGDFRALQSAYMTTRPSPGKALLATIEGRIAKRPSMEESLPPQDTLVVERFISLAPHGSCRSPDSHLQRRST